MKKIKDSKNLEKRLRKSRQPVLVYVFTPMCGTCQLAERLLHVLEEMDGIPPLIGIDLNYFKKKAINWEIESVPCLLYIENNQIKDRLYAFESVTKLYSFAAERRK